MKLGFVSAILSDLNLEEVLNFAAAEKYSCVEIMCWPMGKADRRFSGVTHIDVEGFTSARADDIRALCQKTGVSISALGYYPNMLDPDPQVSEVAVGHLKKIIAAAKILGLKNVNSFIGRDWKKTVDDNWPEFLRVWRPLIAFAEDHDIRIGIENCPMFFSKNEWPGGKNLMTTPAIWRRAFNDIPSRHFGLNYDPSHFVLQQMDPMSPLKEFADRFFHMHAKDVKIHRDRLNDVGIFALPSEWHQPRIPGYGEMNWDHFMAALMETPYRGPVCVEIEDDTFGKTLEGRKTALKVARNILSRYFEI